MVSKRTSLRVLLIPVLLGVLAAQTVVMAGFGPSQGGAPPVGAIQTPWVGAVNGGGYDLTNSGNVTLANGKRVIYGTTAGSVSAPNLVMDPDGDGNTGVYTGAANRIGLTAGGISALEAISASTRVFIGAGWSLAMNDGTGGDISGGTNTVTIASTYAGTPEVTVDTTGITMTTGKNVTTVGTGDLVSGDDLTVADDATITDALAVNGNTALGNLSTADNVTVVGTLTAGVDGVGTAGQVLTSGGPYANMTWETVAAGGADPSLLGNGTAGAPSYSFTSDTDTGIYRVGSNQLGFSSGSTLMWTMSTSALIGTAGGVSQVRGAPGAAGVAGKGLKVSGGDGNAGATTNSGSLYCVGGGSDGSGSGAIVSGGAGEVGVSGGDASLTGGTGDDDGSPTTGGSVTASGGSATDGVNGTVTIAGNLLMDKSINTTAGDAATIDDVNAGRFRKDTSGATFTLTCNRITANSVIIITLASGLTDWTASICSISAIAGAGSVVVTFNAAPTGNADFNFLVIN